MTIELRQTGISKLADTQCNDHILIKRAQWDLIFFVFLEISVNSIVPVANFFVSILNFVHDLFINNNILLFFICLQSSQHSINLICYYFFQWGELLYHILELFTLLYYFKGYFLLALLFILVLPNKFEKICNFFVLKGNYLIKCITKIFSIKQYINLINYEYIHLLWTLFIFFGRRQAREFFTNWAKEICKFIPPSTLLL